MDAPDLVRQEEAGGDAPALERRVRGDIVRLGLGPLRRRGEGPGQQERGVLADLDEVPGQDVGELDRRMGVDLGPGPRRQAHDLEEEGPPVRLARLLERPDHGDRSSLLEAALEGVVPFGVKGLLVRDDDARHREALVHDARGRRPSQLPMLERDLVAIPDGDGREVPQGPRRGEALETHRAPRILVHREGVLPRRIVVVVLLLLRRLVRILIVVIAGIVVFIVPMTFTLMHHLFLLLQRARRSRCQIRTLGL